MNGVTRAALAVLLAAVTGPGVFACQTAGDPASASMEIELDAFSGRPNPRWTLPPEEAGSIVDALSALPEVVVAEAPANLGYRGFVLRHPAFEARVYDGHVFLTKEGATRRLRDVHQVERVLAEQARDRGFGAAVDSVGGLRDEGNRPGIAAGTER